MLTSLSGRFTPGHRLIRRKATPQTRHSQHVKEKIYPQAKEGSVPTFYHAHSIPGYRFHDRGIGVRFPVGSGDALYLYSVEIVSGKHSTCWPMGTIWFLTAVKRPGRKADHPFRQRPRLNMRGTIPPILYTSSRGCWNKHRDSFALHMQERHDVSRSQKTNKTVSVRVLVLRSIRTADRKTKYSEMNAIKQSLNLFCSATVQKL